MTIFKQRSSINLTPAWPLQQSLGLESIAYQGTPSLALT